jgi:hypothetical protein
MTTVDDVWLAEVICVERSCIVAAPGYDEALAIRGVFEKGLARWFWYCRSAR